MYVTFISLDIVFYIEVDGDNETTIANADRIQATQGGYRAWLVVKRVCWHAPHYISCLSISAQECVNAFQVGFQLFKM